MTAKYTRPRLTQLTANYARSGQASQAGQNWRGYVHDTFASTPLGWFLPRSYAQPSPDFGPVHTRVPYSRHRRSHSLVHNHSLFVEQINVIFLSVGTTLHK